MSRDEYPQAEDRVPTPESNITAMFRELEDRRDELARGLEVLTKRLTRVLSINENVEARRDDAAVKEAASRGLSPMATHLSELSEQFSTSIRQLNRIIDRIEL